ncbi:uncharacterized protein CDV56_107422 [Aspergillus thermomutatus]|uniref:Uncharacterized protein n=1 Tax=Aspergillus thermomutatus TaxID=41047 RepID=A0A397H8E3_ASPTH|nr:uncharacterized protein CDV56_107422 [Aspergillus thermomutatus]RHZ59267.1 hypothetical protein CDV56_107422 [Aspergillus thermomutatus]
MNALKCLYMDAYLYFYKRALRKSTGRKRDELILLGLLITTSDPEATEPALGVHPWFASNPESYTPNTFLSNFRLKIQPCWAYDAWHSMNPQPLWKDYDSEPYDLDPKIYSELAKLEKKKAISARPTEARTVAGKYELRLGTRKEKDMYHPFAMETRRLIACSDHTITFTNPEGQRRDLLAVVVANEKRGDAENPLLAYMALYLYARHGSSTHSDTAYCADCMHYAMSVDAKIRHAEQGGAENVRGNGQFFRYALDVSCRGGLFADKRCLDYRRGFLGDAKRYMDAVGEPYEACRGIGACR